MRMAQMGHLSTNIDRDTDTSVSFRWVDGGSDVKELGFHSIQSIDASEVYQKGNPNFLPKIGIWTKVAETRGLQMQQDGYVTNDLRLQAIKEYNEWIKTDAKQMIMKLKDVRAITWWQDVWDEQDTPNSFIYWLFC